MFDKVRRIRLERPINKLREKASKVQLIRK